jgi:4-amino-4-deoxy-L-arabinose transferase-like glycosyltransferase
MVQPDLPVNPRARDFLLLSGFCVFLFFYGSGQFGLVGADEPRYAQIAREMLDHHEWITPTLGGEAWLEKPPLYYWQAMFAYKMFGVHDWSARLPSAVDASLIVLAVYFFMRKLRPGFHLDAALMTASAAGLVGFAHAASTDMPLAAMFCLAMLAWYTWWETSQKLYLAAFYFFLGLAALAKGPVAIVLAGCVIALFAAAARQSRIILGTLWLPGVLLFLAAALPWYIAVQVRRPEFFRVFILEHNFARFGTNLYHHVAPFWYYLPVTALALVPWFVFTSVAVVEVVRAWWRERKMLLDSENALSFYLILWLIVPFVFFSLSRSKLPGYILPVIPAGTVLVAEYIRRHAGENRPSLWLSGLHAIVAAAPLIPALTIASLLSHHRLPWSVGTEVAAVIALLLTIGIAVTLRSKLGIRLLYFVTLVPVLFAVAALIRIGAPVADRQLSVRPVAKQLSAIETRPLPVAVLGVDREIEYGLAYYRNQIVSRYELHQVPVEEHLLVAPEGTASAVAKFVGSRRVVYLGNFAPQKLDLFWVKASS